MIEYNGFLKNLKQELSELKELEKHLTEKLKDTPEGSLNILKKNGSPLPEFETDENHDYFITRLFVRVGFYDYLKDNNSDQ